MIRLCSFAGLLLISTLSYTQPDDISTALMNTPKIVIEEIPVDFRGNSQNSFSAFIVSEENPYSKDLKNWLKNKYGVEAKKSSGYFSSVKMVLAAWSTDSITIHYKVDKDGNGVRLNFLAQRNDGFVSSSSRQEIASLIKGSLEQQIREFYIKYYDEKISRQQKHYESQVKDLAKLRKKSEKLNNEIDNQNKSIQRSEDEIRTTGGKISDAGNKVSGLKSTIEQQQKETAQTQKEMDENLSFLKAKQAEFDSYNKTGDLNTKPAQKAIKEKEKLEAKALKLQDRLTKNKEAVTKSENAILKAEQEKVKLESKIDELKSGVEKKKSEVGSLKRDLDSNDRDIKDEESQVSTAKNDLEKLKSAKGGLYGQ